MSNIYDLHDKAFSQVSAYVVMHEGKRVATIAIKFPRDGAGRLWSYVHWIGEPMVRGYAGGYGYDKRTAACSAAAAKLTAPSPDDCLLDSPRSVSYWLEEYARKAGWKTADLTPGMLVNDSMVDEHGQAAIASNWEEAYALNHEDPTWRSFRGALAADTGKYWSDQLRDAGFDVWQAV